MKLTNPNAIASLSPSQSKAARRELHLSQRDLIAETGLPAYKLKQFEAGHFRPDLGTLKTLREFYEARGIDFAEIDAHLADPAPTQAAADGEPTATAATDRAWRPGFFFSPEIPLHTQEALLQAMEDNDDAIADCLNKSFETGLLGGFSDETDSVVRDLFGRMASNYLMVRFLQGRNILGPVRDEAKSVADFLAQWTAQQGIPALTEAPAPIKKANGYHVLASAEQE
jgi:transcriptional regulator with XRE-family HTH domain